MYQDSRDQHERCFSQRPQERDPPGTLKLASAFLRFNLIMDSRRHLEPNRIIDRTQSKPYDGGHDQSRRDSPEQKER
jgi:hypothetical protein